MASIRKRNSKFQVQIRRSGSPSISKTFHHRKDALAWAREMEIEADRNHLQFNPRALQRIRLKDLVERYRDEVSVHKRSAEIETVILNAFLREPMCSKRMSELANSDFAAYRDRALQTVKSSTLNRRFAILSNIFEVARIEWGLPITSNPVAGIRKPRNGPSRNRRLKDGEYERLIQAAKRCRNPHIGPIICFAVETAIRRGEILAVTRETVDFKRRTLRIPMSKNGYSRVIPLSDKAREVLCGQLDQLERDTTHFFPISANALRLAWDRVRLRARIEDLRFHDLRHEGISRLFEIGKSMPEIAAISGHRDFRMLARYAHVR